MNEFIKNHAISDLKSEISILASQYAIDLTVGNAESMPNRFAALTDPIVDDLPYIANELSPTPLDPYNRSIEGGISYVDAALLLMSARNHEATQPHTLPNSIIQLIDIETEEQHRNQCNYNALSYGRLLDSIRKNPDRFDIETLDLIQRVRSGNATTIDRIQLLALYPELKSIEDMKLTCPLDMKSFRRAQDTYGESLRGLSFHGFSVEFVAPHDRKSRRIDTSTSPVYADSSTDEHRALMIIKSKIAEVWSSSTPTIEAVVKQTYCALPVRPQLRHVAENIVPIGDSKFNLQPLSVSMYLRFADRLEKPTNRHTRQLF